jgi:hypothetical protein
MTAASVSALIYLVAGLAVIYLFQERRRELGSLSRDRIPELDDADFATLTILLKTAYERMLYLGVLFLPLAWSTYSGSDRVSTLFFLLLIGLLFLSNIGPRNRIMRMLDRYNLSIPDLRQRGITL